MALTPTTSQQESMFEEAPAPASAQPEDTDWQASAEASAAEPGRSSPRSHSRSVTVSSSVLTVDDFAALEERVLAAVSLVRRERQARVHAEERASALEAQLQQLQSETQSAAHLQHEIDSLRAEREQVRIRVERLLGQLDALEL